MRADIPGEYFRVDLGATEQICLHIYTEIQSFYRDTWSHQTGSGTENNADEM